MTISNFTQSIDRCVASFIKVIFFSTFRAMDNPDFDLQALLKITVSAHSMYFISTTISVHTFEVLLNLLLVFVVRVDISSVDWVKLFIVNSSVKPELVRLISVCVPHMTFREQSA